MTYQKLIDIVDELENALDDDVSGLGSFPVDHVSADELKQVANRFGDISGRITKIVDSLRDDEEMDYMRRTFE